MLHQRHILKSPKLHCLFNGLLKLTTKKISTVPINGPLYSIYGESTSNRWIRPTKGQ